MNKIGRNNPCRCGSGKKYKQCCLKQDEALAHERFVQQKAERTAAEDAARLKRQQQRAEMATWGQGDDESDQLVADSNGIIAMVKAGDLDVAEAAAHAFLERFPYVHDGYDRLGMVEEARGNPKAAADWYRKCLQFVRDHPQYYESAVEERYLEDIRRLDPDNASV